MVGDAGTIVPAVAKDMIAEADFAAGIVAWNGVVCLASMGAYLGQGKVAVLVDLVGLVVARIGDPLAGFSGQWGRCPG